MTVSTWPAGIDKAARDMTQMQRSSQQIERALERVKIIQRGAGTLVRPARLAHAPSGYQHALQPHILEMSPPMMTGNHSACGSGHTGSHSMLDLKHKIPRQIGASDAGRVLGT